MGSLLTAINAWKVWLALSVRSIGFPEAPWLILYITSGGSDLTEHTRLSSTELFLEIRHAYFGGVPATVT